MSLLSSEYKRTLAETHRVTKNAWGGGHSVDKLPKYEAEMSKLGVRSILDYGCANGKFKVYMEKKKPHYNIYEYDPGIRGKDMLPSPCDYVVCCDVMEHVEEDYLEAVMTHLKSVVVKGGFFNISTKSAITILSDGTNAHKIVKDGDWWVDIFKKYFDVYDVEVNRIETSFKVLPKSS